MRKNQWSTLFLKLSPSVEPLELTFNDEIEKITKKKQDDKAGEETLFGKKISDDDDPESSILSDDSLNAEINLFANNKKRR